MKVGASRDYPEIKIGGSRRSSAKRLSPGMRNVLAAISDGKWHKADEPRVRELLGRDCAVEDCVDLELARARTSEVTETEPSGGLATSITSTSYAALRITESGKEALRTGKY